MGDGCFFKNIKVDLICSTKWGGSARGEVERFWKNKVLGMRGQQAGSVPSVFLNMDPRVQIARRIPIIKVLKTPGVLH